MFARLSIIFPRTGGPYAYTRKGLGDFIGFQTAYNYWIALWVGNAAIALAAIGYLRFFFPVLDNKIATAWAAIAIVWLFTIVSIRGARSAGIMQLLTLILKLVPLLLIGIIGWHYIHPEFYSASFNQLSPHHSNAFAITAGASLTLWAFIGLESATVPADSVDNPKRKIPLATIIGTLLAAFVYIASSAAIMGIIPAKELMHSSFPFALAAQKMFGSWGEFIVAIGATVSCLGSLNGWTLLQGQVAMAAAEDDLFPKRFANRNKRGAPAYALIITAILISGVLLLTMSKNLVTQFQIIILLAVLATLIPYFYTALAGFIVFRDDGWCGKKRFAGNLLLVAALAYICWAIIGSGQQILYYGALLLMSSVPVYAWLVYARNK